MTTIWWDRYFYHENVFRVRHAFEVLEDDIDATARRLIESVKDAQQSIAQKGCVVIALLGMTCVRTLITVV
jgi:CHAD domain-containing protein